MQQTRRAPLHKLSLLCLIGSLGLSQAADLSGLPTLTEGQWQVTSVVQLKGKAPEKSGTFTHACLQPVKSLEQEILMAEKSGCKASVVTHVGDEYKYSLDCGGGKGNRYILQTKRSDDFIYTTVSDGDSAVETWHRLGDCKREPNKALKKDAQ